MTRRLVVRGDRLTPAASLVEGSPSPSTPQKEHSRNRSTACLVDILCALGTQETDDDAEVGVRSEVRSGDDGDVGGALFTGAAAAEDAEAVAELRRRAAAFIKHGIMSRINKDKGEDTASIMNSIEESDNVRGAGDGEGAGEGGGALAGADHVGRFEQQAQANRT
jgi:hypothetical protein